MTIKNQLRLFLIGIIAVPFLCSIFPPIYHYLTRPDKILMDGSNKILKMSELKMSEKDTDILKEVMKTLPPKVEFMLIADRTEILLTNFAEFENQETITDEQLFHHIKKTSNKYFYQFVAPPLEDQSIDMMLISRVNRDFQKNHIHEKKWDKALFWLILLIVISEAFCIPMTIHISSTITKSITLLEKNTQRIVSGELDVELENKKPRNENEITRLTKNLEKMRLDLKDDGERRAKFIMGISHDLRTPVAVIKGYTEAMSDGVFETVEEMKKPIEIISEKTEQLETMINTLINFVKLNQTEWQHQLKKQKIAPTIHEFAKSFVTTGEIFKRNVESDINIPEEIEIPFDKLLFQRAMENLFTNAVRYTNEGDTIRIVAFSENGEIKIKIADTGSGIEKKDIDKIFDLFYRGSNSRRESGMGIGLSVVKKIITTHGWTIDVKSQKGIGTEFTITIPTSKSDEKNEDE
ncbi:MAG: HAMP domain-containing histidine kinase [Treponema sp.]|nr:HAMP domain-containing histidine kinase [Treponema sp.]